MWSLAAALNGLVQEMASCPTPGQPHPQGSLTPRAAPSPGQSHPQGSLPTLNRPGSAGRLPTRAGEHFFLVRTLFPFVFSSVAASCRVKDCWLKKNLHPTDSSDGFYCTLPASVVCLFLLFLALLFIRVVCPFPMYISE